NPERVFLVGDGNYRFSTRTVGYFLWPTAVFLAVGLARIRHQLPTRFAYAMAIGIVFSAVPAVLASDLEIKRWLSVLIFIVFVSGCGAMYIWNTGRRGLRAICIVLSALAIWQFVGFWRDYRGDYRAASAFYYGGNNRGAVRQVLAQAKDPGCVFLDD